jgi:WD40 repeat protein
LEGYVDIVWSLAFMPDGKTLFTTGRKAKAKELFRWDLATGHCQASPRGHLGLLSKVAVSPDGRMLATGGDSTVRLWDTTTDKELAVLQAHPEGRGTGWGIQSLTFAPNSRVLATGGNAGLVKLWSVPAGELMATLKGHTNWVWTLAFSPDGKRLASGSTDLTARLWNVVTGTEEDCLKWDSHVCSVAFSPRGDKLAIGGESEAVQVWSLTAPKATRRRAPHQAG